MCTASFSVIGVDANYSVVIANNDPRGICLGETYIAYW